MPNRVLAIMITDMKGFTKATTAMTRAEIEELTQMHRSLIVPTVTNRGGRLIKSLGDGFLIAFDSPTDGLECGLEIQRQLAQYNSALAQAQRLEVRVALALGEVRDLSSDVEGEAVNLAARLVAQTLPGQVLFTESVRLAAKRSEFACRDAGYMEFKGIDEVVQVHELLHEKSEETDWPGDKLLESLSEEIVDGNWRKTAVRIERLSGPYLSVLSDPSGPNEPVVGAIARLEKLERFLIRLAERALRFKVSDALSADGGVLSHFIQLYETASGRNVYDGLMKRMEGAQQAGDGSDQALDPARFLDRIFQSVYLLGMFCLSREAFAALHQILEAETTDRAGKKAPLVAHPRCTWSKDGVLNRIAGFCEEENAHLGMFHGREEIARLLAKFNLLVCAWCESYGLSHPPHFMVDPNIFEVAIGELREHLEPLEVIFKDRWKETVYDIVRRHPFQDFFMPKLLSAWK